jgi:hypothetical protein
MNTLTIKLKQHTPLIHFQHDQDGATLRASEVKPKLDKFVLTRLGNGIYQEGINIAKDKGWLIGKGEHPALDYKMRIEAIDIEAWDINETQVYTDKHRQGRKPFIKVGNKEYLAKRRASDGRIICQLKTYPLFFANLDADYTNPNEYRKFSFTEDPLSLFLTTKNNSLYFYIADADLLNDFFFQTNFGTRQSKGFGSFSIDESDALFRTRRSMYRFRIKQDKLKNTKTLDEEYQKVFEYIELFYKTLRGGINLKNGQGLTLFYFKSLAYKYAYDILNAKWDKRKIKEEFYNIERENMPHTYDIKDMLGFSTNEQWLNQNKDTITKESELAERMQSPILFKPFYDDDTGSYTINIILQDEMVDMASFKKTKTVKISSRNARSSFDIELPQAFSTQSFFDYIFNQLDFDISNYVDDQFHNHRFYRDLEYIYSQIKENI